MHSFEKKPNKRRHTAIRLCAILCTVSMLLSGCSALDISSSDLYSLPKLAGFVTELQTEIDKVLADGGEYSAPTSGTNRQSVQMEDLDGDGSEEAIVFVRVSDGLKICVFHVDEDGGYSLSTEVTAEGISFDSVGYVDLIGNGQKDMLVGISFGSGIPKALSVIALGSNGPWNLLTATYTGYTQLDIDGNGKYELIIARHNAEFQNGVAEVYSFSAENGTLSLDASVPLSEGISALRRIKTGYLRDGAPAVFITGLTNADGTERVFTDICAYRDSTLANITLNPETGQSCEVVTSVGIHGTDIDGDGVFDLPLPVLLATYQDRATNDIFRKLIWRNYALDGTDEEVIQTFHNSSDGWYFILPAEWKDANLAVDRRSSVSGERAITFSIVSEDGIATPILELYALTGDNRENRSTLPGRFVISNSDTRTVASTIYAGKLGTLERGSSYEKYLPSIEDVSASFKLIQTEWLTGELTN